MNFYYIALQNVCYLFWFGVSFILRSKSSIRALFWWRKYRHIVLFYIKITLWKDLTGNVKPETKVFEWVCEMWFILLLYTMFKKEVSWYLGKMLWPELYFYPSLNGQGDKILTKSNLKYYCDYSKRFHFLQIYVSDSFIWRYLDKKHWFCHQFVEKSKNHIFFTILYHFLNTFDINVIFCRSCFCLPKCESISFLSPFEEVMDSHKIWQFSTFQSKID